METHYLWRVWIDSQDFDELKRRIKDKGLSSLLQTPTIHQLIQANDNIASTILELINDMLIDLLEPWLD